MGDMKPPEDTQPEGDPSGKGDDGETASEGGESKDGKESNPPVTTPSMPGMGGPTQETPAWVVLLVVAQEGTRWVAQEWVVQWAILIWVDMVWGGPRSMGQT